MSTCIHKKAGSPIPARLSITVALALVSQATVAGNETASITYTNDVPYVSTVELADKQVARIAEHILIAINDSGGGFMNNTAASCIVQFVDEPDKPRVGTGYCSYSDSDGDRIFEKYTYTTAATGTVEVTGGTGKYAGVTCSGTWKKMAAPKPPVKGKWQNIGRKTMDCSMP